MFNWLKKKAAEKQEANFRTSLTRLISEANEVNAALEFVGNASSEQRERIKELQRSLAYDFLGPVPAENLKTRIIDPALGAPNVSDGARLAVMHVYDTVLKKRG